MIDIKLYIFKAEHLQQNASKCTLRYIWNGCLAIAGSVTCSIVSGCQNCENQDVEEEGSDGEAHKEDVIYMTAMNVTKMGDCCEKVLRSSGALQPIMI